MRTTPLALLCLPALACLVACPSVDSTGEDSTETETSTSTSGESTGDGDGDDMSGDGDGDDMSGDGDGDDTTGDGDGDDTTGDGDGDDTTGDGDGDDTTGDGDGDDTTGDGDGDDTTGDGDGDDTTGDGDGDPLPPDSPCLSLDADPDTFIALIVGETEAFLLRQDGSTLALDTSLPDAEPGAELALEAGVGEDWFTVISYDAITEYLEEEEFAPEHDLAHYRVWSKSTGELAWEQVEAATGSEPNGEPRVGADGRIAVLVPYLWDGTEGRLVAEGGVLGDFFNCIPQSGPGPDNWYACVSFLEPQPRWNNAALDQSFSGPNVYSDTYFRYEVLTDGSFRYFGDVEGAIGLMQARLDDVDFTPWPEGQAALMGSQLRVHNFTERWFIVSSGGNHQLLRFGEDTAPLVSPPEHPTLRTNSNRVLPVDNGQMLVGWANDDAEFVYIHEGAQAGQPFAGFVPVSGHSKTYIGITEGTYWVRTSGTSNGWGEPPPEALLGRSMQLARPSANTELAFEVFGSRLPTLHASGRCVARAVSDQPGDPWIIDDLETLDSVELPEPGRVLWF